jgi:hypothetical protein
VRNKRAVVGQLHIKDEVYVVGQPVLLEKNYHKEKISDYH